MTNFKVGAVAGEVLGGRLPRGLPAQARAVFVGELFVVWQWPQVLYDGSVATFEAVTRPSGSSVIALQERDGVQGFCFARQTQPDRAAAFESLFGGRLDSPDEDPLAAAQRELREESGMVSEDWALVEEVVFNRGKVLNTEWVWVARNCRVVGEQELDAGEKITVCWRPLAEFPTWLLGPDNRQQYLKSYLFSALDMGAWGQLRSKLEGVA